VHEPIIALSNVIRSFATSSAGNALPGLKGLAIIGVTPRALILWQSLTLASVLFHHSNSRLPPDVERALAWFFVTPRMHAIHHSTERHERDSNYSSGLSVWDRLHGTLRDDRAETDVRIGIDGYDTPADVALLRILPLPFESRPPARPAADA